MPVIDLTGIKFGKLLVCERRGSSPKDQQAIWLCKCECGQKTIVKAGNLKSGKVKSCGCFKGGKGESRKYKQYTGKKYKYLTVIKEVDKIGQSRAWLCKCICGNHVIKTSGDLTRTQNGSCGCIPNGHKHGNSYAKFYVKWLVIKSRCYNENDKSYPDYGGRGIKMCDEWVNDYYLFHKWVEENYVKGMTIDRIENDGPYAPWNCRFATPKQQANNRRSNKKIKYKGQLKTISEWSSIIGIKAVTIRSRLKKGWTVQEAFTIKPNKNAH